MVLNLSSNVICNSNGETNFQHLLLLPNRQVSRLRTAFANNLSANIKLWKTQLHKSWDNQGDFLVEFHNHYEKHVCL